MITIGQMEVVAAKPEQNMNTAIEIINKAKNNWSDMIVLPEQVLWYMIWDTWERDWYIKECIDMNQDIIESTKWWITAIWWNVSTDFNKRWYDWRVRKYNSAFIARDGKLLSNWVNDWIIHKALMPDYRYFDDSRHFMSLIDFAKENNKEISDYYTPYEVIIDWVKKSVSIMICEDIWNYKWDYIIDPVKEAMKHKPDIITVPSSSPMGINKDIMRKKILTKQSINNTLIYVNPVWIQNNWKNVFIFDWWSSIYKDWNEIENVVDFNENSNQIIPPAFQASPFNKGGQIEINNSEKILKALIYGTKNFMKQIWQKKVVIGLSWWLDSAVVTAICTIALWKENVTTINMPSKYNSDTTKNLAKQTAVNLWVIYKKISIEESIKITHKQFKDAMWEKPTWLVAENIQARDRWARILAGIAGMENAVFTNNWNKTEIAMWYATLYGDTNWVISIIGDLYKSQVFELAREINREYGEIIPEQMINMQPSAELSNEQNVDEGLWDPFNYEYLDKLLYQFVELRKMPEDILEYHINNELEEKLWIDKNILEYFDNIDEFINDMEKVFRTVEISVFKRIQMPPTISISKRAFWYDLRESQGIIDFNTRRYKRMKERIK